MAKAKSATRRGERELAFQVLYGLSFTPARDIDDLRRIFRISPDYIARWEGQDPPSHPSGFAWELVAGVWSKSDELDAAITNFSRNWRVDRMIPTVNVLKTNGAITILISRRKISVRSVMLSDQVLMASGEAYSWWKGLFFADEKRPFRLYTPSPFPLLYLY